MTKRFLPFCCLAMITLVGCDSRQLSLSAPESPDEVVSVESSAPAQTPSLDFFRRTISWQERIEEVRRDLPLLPQEKLDAYLAHIGSHQPTPENEEDYWVIMNEILEVIRKETLLPERYTDLLVNYLETSETNHMVRDYAAQHLGIWLSGDGGTGEVDAEKIQRGLTALASVAANPIDQKQTVAGTALMALYDASQRLPNQQTAPIWAEIEPQLVSSLPTSPVVFKTSLINVAGLQNLTSLHPQIKQYATDHPSDSVRLSSIAALGSYQNADDKALLTQIKLSNSKFTYAASSALNKF